MTAIADYLTTDEVLQQLGERLKNRRLERNLPVDQLAEKVGLNRKTILDMEAGGDVRLSSVVKLLRGLNMLGVLEAALPDVLPGSEAFSARGHLRRNAYTGRRPRG